MAHVGPKSEEMAQDGSICRKATHIGSFCSAYIKPTPGRGDRWLSAQLSNSQKVSLP